MILFDLVTANILRWKIRSIFTFFTIVIAFLLLALLLPVNRMFNVGVEVADANRLISVNKSSFLRPMPLSYLEVIKKIEGVKDVGHFTFFGGFYQNQDNQVAATVTDPKVYSQLVPEMVFSSPTDLDDWIKDPAGVAVGREMAEKYHWKVGDIIPIYSAIHQRSNGSFSWTFNVKAIFDTTKKGGSTNSMLINYDYFNQARLANRDLVGWYSIVVSDPNQANAIASTIDKKFQNSPNETKTSSEKVFAQSFLRQVGNFGIMISLALGAVFFTLILVVANTLSQSVNERMSELALLKTVGYSDKKIMAMVIGESLLFSFGGCFAGFLIAAIAIPQVALLSDQLLSTLQLWWRDLGYGILGAAGLTIAAIILPGLRITNMEISKHLAKTV